MSRCAGATLVAGTMVVSEVRRLAGIPFLKGGRGRDADSRDCDDTIGARKVRDGNDLLPAPETQNGSSQKEQGNVGANLGRQLEAFHAG